VSSGESERTRDAERTREAILAAAENRFARLGFDRTSLQEIGEAAGVARSTPAYFFGSKEALYEAVLARVITRAQEAMANAYAGGGSVESPEDAVVSYASAFIDFLDGDRNFLRLIQREALGDGSRVAKFFASSVDEGVAAFRSVAERAGVTPQRLILDVTALCWYPFAHEHTVLPALGMNARDARFLDEQKRHVGDVVRAIVRQGTSAADAAT
jgi:AcrR family transcriptional regulator